MKTCKFCHRTLPDSSFGLRYGHVRYKICRQCMAVGHSCIAKPRPEPRKKMTDEERRAHRAEYFRQYRETHREQMRQSSRQSINRRRAGLPPLKPGRKTGVPVKAAAVPAIQPPKPKPLPVVKGCLRCQWYPCFDGIDNLESDFSITCKSYRQI